MNRKRTFFLVLLLFCSFVGVVYYFLHTAYQSEGASNFSTQNTSRLGTRALFGSFGRMDSLEVRRHYRELNELLNGRRETIFFLGVRPGAIRPDFGTLVQELLEEGDRVVVGMHPEGIARAESQDGPDSEGVGVPRRITGYEFRVNPATVQSDRNVFSDLEFEGAESGSDAITFAERTGSERPLPPRIPLRNRVQLLPGDDWTELYRIDDEPAVLEKTGSGGRLLVTASSYPFTNHALRDHRFPSFLRYCIGPNRSIVFHETHLGRQRTRGVMTLARDYGLTLFFVTLICMGLLYIWKNSTSLVPPFEPASWQADEQAVEGRDAHGGLLNLLRNRVDRRKLLSLCLNEYKRDVKKGWAGGNHLKEAEALVEEGKHEDDEQIVQLYRRVSHLFRSEVRGRDEIN